MNRFLHIISCIIIIAFSAQVHAQSDLLFNPLPKNTDLRPAQEELLAKIRGRKTTKNARTFTINKSNLLSGTLKFNFSKNRTFSASRLSLKKKDSQEIPVIGDEFSWVGQSSNGTPGDSIIYVDKNGLVTGTFSTSEGQFEIRPLGGDAHVVIEINPDEFPPEHPGKLPIAPDDRSNNLKGVAPDSLAQNTVDIYIAYTPAAAANYASLSGHANLAINTANTVYNNTNIKARLRLVGIGKVGYNESSSMEIDLQRLQKKGDGYLDEIHSKRDAIGADLVHLMVDRDDYCGYAYVKASKDYAFGVTDHTCVGSNKSFTHEVGHNFGGCHDPDNAGDCPNPYAHGYQDPSQRYRTVMAYNCSSGCPRRPIHSHPTQHGTAAIHDVRRVIRERANIIAGFRRTPAVRCKGIHYRGQWCQKCPDGITCPVRPQ